MKVAQFLSTVPDALPAEYAAELAQLQANAPPMGWAFVRRRMAANSGPDWRIALRRASATKPRRPRASARCTAPRCPTAREVACKLQYPDMASTVEADLRQLKLAMAIYHRMDSAIHHDEIYKELTERLREELDYVREAAQMRLYGLMLAQRSDRACAGADRRLLHQAAADDDLARWPPAACAGWTRTRRRRSATGSPRRCSAPGMCRSTATA